MKDGGSRRKGLKEFFDAVARHRSGFYNRRGGFAEIVQNMILRIVIDAVANTLHFHDRMLDVGCGRGNYLSALKEAGFTGVGIDISVDMLKLARRRICRKDRSGFLIQGTADLLPFRDKSFHYAICIDVLHHFTHTDREQVIQELDRVVKPNGEIVIEIKNKMNILYWLLSKFNPAPLSETTTLNELVPFLKALGFDTIKTKGVLFPIPIFAPLILIQASHRKQSLTEKR